MNLEALIVEARTREQNAQRRGRSANNRAELAFLSGVRVALAELQLRVAEEARIEREELKRRSQIAEEQRQLAADFNDPWGKTDLTGEIDGLASGEARLEGGDSSEEARSR